MSHPRHRLRGRNENRRDETVDLVVERTDATDVRVTGSFCGWSPDGVRLTHDAYGMWHARLHLEPGRYEYRLLADGAWCDDPRCPERVANPFGSSNCVLTVA